jgi:hypothetical protein
MLPLLIVRIVELVHDRCQIASFKHAPTTTDREPMLTRYICIMAEPPRSPSIGKVTSPRLALGSRVTETPLNAIELCCVAFETACLTANVRNLLHWS